MRKLSPLKDWFAMFTTITSVPLTVCVIGIITRDSKLFVDCDTQRADLLLRIWRLT